MKFDNALTRMTGIQYPIIQGAFGLRGTGTSSIAVPTSEAGGLGILLHGDQSQQDPPGGGPPGRAHGRAASVGA